MDYIELQARLRPQKTAVVDLASERSWTYNKLDRYIAGCAGVLSARGVTRGDRVANLSRNRAEIIVLQQACARLGAMFVPLNWRLSPTELRALLEDCAPKLLFGDSQAGDLGFDCEAIDQLPELCAGAIPYQAAPIDPDAPSLILYTSGSTGTPKGALLSEKNLTETAINFTLLGSVDSNSVFLCDAPMFHVIGLVTNVRPTFFNGGRVLISDAFQPDRTVTRLMDPSLQITHYFCVPQMAQALRRSRAFDPSRLRGLTAIFTGGAPHPEPQIREWLQDRIPIVDGFGMSETGTVFGMPVDFDLIDRKAGSVGIPTPRIRARVVDSEDIETPVGVAGDLQLKGDNVFGGYWNREQDYRAAITSDGWFRTDDVAAKDEDGYFRIVGRKKEMYISGGENVYPAEIESLVVAHPNVEECAVVGVPDERWGEVGFLFVAGEAAADEQSILASLDGKLARYKIPKHTAVIDKLPRNGAGKVVKSALTEIAFQRLNEGNK